MFIMKCFAASESAAWEPPKKYFLTVSMVTIFASSLHCMFCTFHTFNMDSKVQLPDHKRKINDD